MVEQLIIKLKEGVVTIVFEKIDTGEIRIMPCTLNKEVGSLNGSIANQRAVNETIVVYALDKKAWRDVRVNTIKDWYIGYPK